MDVLGNILKNMTKPPVLAEDAEKKRRLEEAKRLRLEEQRKVQSFQEKMQERISKFAENEKEERLQLEPMSKPQRALVYNLLETLPYDFVSHSFGREELDRHLVIFKPEHVPCEAELHAMKRGEEYVPAAAPEPELDEERDSEQSTSTRGSAKDKKPPEYLQKYAKYLGSMEDAKEAAQSTETKRVYGYVSSELKKDKRTIEETLADIQARKKQKQ